MTESPQPTNAPLNAAMMASLVVCTVLGLVTSIASLTTVPQPLSHSLSVTAEWPAAAAVGSLARASFIIENRSSHSHEQVRLRLPERLFQHFECLAVQPQPQAEESLGSYRYLYLGTLPPQQRIELSMTLRAQTRGAFSCQARVFTRDNVCFPSGARQLAVLHRAGDSS